MNATLSNDTGAMQNLIAGSQLTRMFVTPDAKVGINDQLMTGIDADGCKELVDGVRRGTKMILVVQAGLDEKQIMALIEKAKDVYGGTNDMQVAGTAADRRIGIHVKSTEVISFDVRKPGEFKKYDLHGAVYRDAKTGETVIGFQNGTEIGLFPIDEAVEKLENNTIFEEVRKTACYLEDGEFLCRGFTGKYGGDDRYLWATDGQDNTSVFSVRGGEMLATYAQYVKPMVNGDGEIDGKLFASFAHADKYDLAILDRDEVVGKTAELIDSWTGNFFADSSQKAHAAPETYRAK